jgi:threonine/homoserine/homoserine lactone efflux protein
MRYRTREGGGLEPLHAVLFGITIAAPAGPIALLLVHTGVNHHLGAALRAAVGVAAADLTYAMLAFTLGAALTSALNAYRMTLQLCSSGLLLALGMWLAYRALLRPAPEGPLAEPAPGMLRLYLLTLANPLTIVLFVAFAGQLHATGIAQIALGALCLFSGSLAVQAAYAAFGSALQRWLKDAVAVRRFNVASGAAIAMFGLYGLVGALGA